MKTSKKTVVMKNGIERFEKNESGTVVEQLIRYNSGACRYEIECAFGVIARTADLMKDVHPSELRELVKACSTANSVVDAYLKLGEAMSDWIRTSVQKIKDVALEKNLLVAMRKFDEAVYELKPYIQ